MRENLKQAFFAVVAISFVMFVVNASSCGTSADRAKYYLARAQAETLADSVGTFVGKNRRLPEALAELTEIDPDGDGRARNVVEQDLRDPWGRSFELHRLKDGSAAELLSLGRDGRKGGSGVDADIVFTVRLPESATH